MRGAVRVEGASRPESPTRRLVLVGFMGSGKSTVGPLLAEALGWDFVDLDQAVEARAGRSIARIFEEEGEDAFREEEHRMARELLVRERVVLATGGGWPCREGRMEGLPPDTLSLWLRATPELALERARRQGVRRPLLEVDRPLDRVRELLAAREPYYRKALWWVTTEHRSPEEVARLVIDRLRTEPERPLRS